MFIDIAAAKEVLTDPGKYHYVIYVIKAKQLELFTAFGQAIIIILFKNGYFLIVGVELGFAQITNDICY